MEWPILQLRKAMGLQQRAMAERLGCGYSTLKSYEKGHQLAEDVRVRAIELALQLDLESLAQLLSAAPGEQSTSGYLEANQVWHDMLETVLRRHDSQAQAAVESSIALAYAWVKRETDEAQAMAKRPAGQRQLEV